MKYREGAELKSEDWFDDYWRRYRSFALDDALDKELMNLEDKYKIYLLKYAMRSFEDNIDKELMSFEEFCRKMEEKLNEN